MIFFDYGQTLLLEHHRDHLKGFEALISKAVKNPKGVTARHVFEFARDFHKDIDTLGGERLPFLELELHNHFFIKYVAEYFGLEFDLSPNEMEQFYWDNIAPAEPTLHIKELLDYLYENNIRTAVVSNLSYSVETLSKRINFYLPQNHFEFMITSSEYIYRKPNRRIFELALAKADVKASMAWYCGDNAYCDVTGASNSGLFPVWYTGAADYKQDKPSVEHLEINDWMRLIYVLEKL